MKHHVSREYNGKQEVNTENFYKELENLYKKYNISISHEDEHGSFILEKFNNNNLNWIKNATIEPSLRDILNSK